jgi:mRNA interferase MazF
MISVQLKFGDVVLLKFPHSDGVNYSKRPALTIADTGDGDVILCRITSKSHKSEYDLEIRPSTMNGLMLDSIIRVHKIATIEKNRIDRKLGGLDSILAEKVKTIFRILV